MNNKLNILVVDDNDIITKQISNYLQKEEISQKIWCAHNGTDACKIIIDSKPDLVLLNLKMPDMNGLDLIERFKNEDIKFVIVSGFIDIEVAQKARKFGVAALINKPFTYEVFKNKIHEAILFSKNELEEYEEVEETHCNSSTKKKSLWSILFG